MKRHLIISCMVQLLSQVSFAADAPCPLPSRAVCGVEEVISCSREAYNLANPPGVQPNTNEAFYNTQLFDASNQDGFCKYKTVKGTYPPGVTIGTLTQVYYDQFCSAQTGEYFSYANFLKAATLNNATTSKPAFGGQGGFACSMDSDKSVSENTAISTREVVNYFASAAQETTSAAMGYTTDGFYNRFENGAIVGCRDLSCKTQYFPPTNPGNWVGVSSFNATDPSQTQSYTPYLWYLSDPYASTYYPQYQIAYSPMTMAYGFPAISLLAASPTASNSQLYKVSAGMSPPLTEAHNINEVGILHPGMYVGMGALQLTGSTMWFYYGWHNNNVAPGAPVLLSNFSNFVGNPMSSSPATDGGFLREGELSFEGANWYWMYRSIGINTSTFPGQMIPTLHQLAMDTSRPACGCVGAVTLMINGGCNDFDKRYKYAQYFSSSDALGVAPQNCAQTVTLPGQTSSVDIDGSKCVLLCPAGYTLVGYFCKKPGSPDVTPQLDQATQNLLTYCQTPISGDYP